MQSQNNLLSCIEINPSAQAIGTVIWLHGLGADGNDFVPIVPELHLPSSIPIRFVFPNAPLRPVTINNGYVMRAWYDITSMRIDQWIDEAGIAASVAQLNDLIEQQESVGIPSQNIILAGFSQGAVIALTAGLLCPKRLGGILALSGYFPNAEKVLANASAENRQTPIFMAHGTGDNIVPYTIGLASSDVLKRAKYPIDWHSYPMAHGVCDAEIRDIGNWVKTIY